MKSSPLLRTLLAVLAAGATGAALASDEPGATNPTDRSSSGSTPMTAEPQGQSATDTRQGASDLTTASTDSRMGSPDSSRLPPAWLDQEGPPVNGFSVQE
jgi:hypothetical protein